MSVRAGERTDVGRGPRSLVEQLKGGLDAPICLTWELTYACNLACIHCLSSSGRRDPRELTTAEAKAVLDELHRLQVFYVNLGGGEPMIRKDFFELTTYAVANGIGVKFSTNGTYLDTVEADLDVEVVHRRQALCRPSVDERPVRRELHPDALLHRVVDELVEVASDHRLAAADVDVEDLEVVELVEDALRLSGRQLVGIATARRRQAVDARQVAGVGQLPRQADRRVQPALQLADERGHEPSS